MLTLDIDLQVLTLEELAEAREVMHHDVAEVAAHDATHLHLHLTHFFEALEHALESAHADRVAEQHVIAEALGIDEASGEWPGA